MKLMTWIWLEMTSNDPRFILFWLSSVLLMTCERSWRKFRIYSFQSKVRHKISSHTWFRTKTSDVLLTRHPEIQYRLISYVSVLSHRHSPIDSMLECYEVTFDPPKVRTVLKALFAKSELSIKPISLFTLILRTW